MTVNLWFDRPLFPEPFIGLPGRTMQWVFDKRTIVGGKLTHLSLVSSGAAPVVARSNEDLIAAALSGTARRTAGRENSDPSQVVRDSRTARDVFARSRSAGTARHGDRNSRRGPGRRLDSDTGCPLRLKAPCGADTSRPRRYRIR